MRWSTLSVILGNNEKCGVVYGSCLPWTHLVKCETLFLLGWSTLYSMSGDVVHVVLYGSLRWFFGM